VAIRNLKNKIDIEENREFILSEDRYCCWFIPCHRSPITAIFGNIPMKGLALFIKFNTLS